MPQTAEHLAILNLLGIARGLVVLTKRDLVDGDGSIWSARRRANAWGGTTLADAPIVAVSATTGAGLDELRAAIDRLLDWDAGTRRRPAHHACRSTASSRSAASARSSPAPSATAP
jgi:selenocysteine-specific translation elongation factor